MLTLEGAAPASEELGSGVGTGTVVGGLGGLAWGPPPVDYSPQLKS